MAVLTHFSDELIDGLVERFRRIVELRRNPVRFLLETHPVGLRFGQLVDEDGPALAQALGRRTGRSIQRVPANSGCGGERHGQRPQELQRQHGREHDDGVKLGVRKTGPPVERRREPIFGVWVVRSWLGRL
jgi:hypothetical protein